MNLYKRTFFLKKGLSFSRYINNLDHESFPPYTLLINKIDRSDCCQIEIVMNDVVMLRRSPNVLFVGGVLFSKCIVQHFKDEGSYTLSASVGFGNVLISSFCVLASFFMFLFGFFIIISGEDPVQVLFTWATILIFLTPFISIYRLEKGLLDKIGLLGSDINEE